MLENLTCFRRNFDYSQTFAGNSITAHSSGHALALGHASAIATCATDGAWLALAVLLTVRTRASVEAVTLDHALEAFAFGDGADLDGVAGLELRELDLVADLERSWELGARS